MEKEGKKAVFLKNGFIKMKKMRHFCCFCANNARKSRNCLITSLSLSLVFLAKEQERDFSKENKFSFEKSRKNGTFFQCSVGPEKATAKIETEQVKKLYNHKYIKQEFLKENIRYEAQEEIIKPNPDDSLG